MELSPTWPTKLKNPYITKNGEGDLVVMSIEAFGVYSSHLNFDKNKKENTYLGLVWSKELIDEIIDNHKFDSFIP